MSRLRRGSRAVIVVGLVLAVAAVASAQRTGRPRPAPRSAPAPRRAEPRRPTVRGQFVFIGGYFYDPFFGPYPWWMHEVYPYRYFPVYDRRAEVRLLVTPRTAAVYVDGFYAGIVDDFDGVFQGLPLPPGGHTIELFLPGYYTVRRSVYLPPATTLRLRESLEPLPPGTASEAPYLAPPVPMPPDGTFRPPVTARPAPVPPPPPPAQVDAANFGTLRLTVQPATATVLVDGAQWLSADGGRFVIEVPRGRHRVEISQPGYTTFARDVEVRAGDTTPLNVSLMRP